MTVRVLLFDDHPVVHLGLTELLNKSGLQVIGHAYDGRHAISKIQQVQPGVIVLDIRMPHIDGLEVLEEIEETDFGGKTIVYSGHDNPTYVARAIALGAADYVAKSEPIERVLRSILNVASGIAVPADGLFKCVQTLMQSQGPVEHLNHNLTSRELQVLRHVSLGLSNREIGRSLGISVETVKEHVQNILRKLNSKDRTQAAVWAVKNGLVELVKPVSSTAAYPPR